MRKEVEDIVPNFDLCKRIPAGEFDDSWLVWRERIGYVSSNISLKFRDFGDINYKAESVKVNCFPAPTLAEIQRDLRNLSVNVIDGVLRVSCDTSSDETFYETVRGDNDVTTAALRMWLRVKGIEVK